jgi:3-oxoacyl-[acyl-carrier protein] reductase
LLLAANFFYSIIGQLTNNLQLPGKIMISISETQIDMKLPLAGKVAIVTGASRGIGQAIAQRLAHDGAVVVVNYVQGKEQAEAVVRSIETSGGKAIAIQADLGNLADIQRLFEQTIGHCGRLDILVNNAGVILSNPIAVATEAEFDRVFAVNTKGAFFAMQEATKHLQDGGRIISISTSLTTNSRPTRGIYVASKAAVEQFTTTLAKELGGRGITVNTVSPGAVETEMTAGLPPEMKQMIIQNTPLGRFGQPQDIANVVAFLASEDGRWLTGQNLQATGGS